jgi:hypothetical protein
LSIDNTAPAIMVNISVVIAVFNDDGFVEVVMITVADGVTIPVPGTILVTPTGPIPTPASSAPAGITL